MTSTSFQHASEQRLFIWEESGGTVEAKPCLLIAQGKVLREGLRRETAEFPSDSVRAYCAHARPRQSRPRGQ